jgi:hypothetical protein
MAAKILFSCVTNVDIKVLSLVVVAAVAVAAAFAAVIAFPI